MTDETIIDYYCGHLIPVVNHNDYGYASTTLISTSFRTNLVKGEYVGAEAEESVDDEPIDIAEEIITDPDKIDEQESQESDEHTDASTLTDIESYVDEEPTQSEEPVNVQLDAPENIGDSTEPGVDTPIDSGR